MTDVESGSDETDPEAGDGETADRPDEKGK